MKRQAAVAVGILALAVTGCAGNAEATSNPYDVPEEDLERVFLEVARDNLSPEGNEFMDHALINNGRKVCPALEANPSADTSAFEFVGLSHRDSMIIAAISVAAWCPEFEDRIPG